MHYDLNKQLNKIAQLIASVHWKLQNLANSRLIIELQPGHINSLWLPDEHILLKFHMIFKRHGESKFF